MGELPPTTEEQLTPLQGEVAPSMLSTYLSEVAHVAWLPTPEGSSEDLTLVMPKTWPACAGMLLALRVIWSRPLIAPSTMVWRPGPVPTPRAILPRKSGNAKVVWPSPP